MNAYASVYVLLGKTFIFSYQKELLFAKAAVLNLYDFYLPCSLHFLLYVSLYIYLYRSITHYLQRSIFLFSSSRKSRIHLATKHC